MTPYYNRDGITLYCADCRDVIAAGVLPLADHVITDPPYGAITVAGARTGNQDTALIEYEPLEAAAIRDVLAGIPTARWGVITCDWRHVLPLEADPPAGWRFVRFGVWVKPNGAPQFSGDRPATGWEAVALLHSTAGASRWNGGGFPAVWTFPRVDGYHPTGKPEALILDFVAAFTDPGELVIDPFCGGGTTLVAAARLGRRAIGVERDERYCAIAVARLAQRSIYTPSSRYQWEGTVDPWELPLEHGGPS